MPGPVLVNVSAQVMPPIPISPINAEAVVDGTASVRLTWLRLADILGELALYGVPLDEITRYTARVDAVTPEQVQGFARRVFDPAQASVLVVGDAKAFAGPLKAARPDLVTIPAAALDLDSPTLAKPAR